MLKLRDKSLEHLAGEEQRITPARHIITRDATYNRALYLDERRAALDAWARYLGQLIDPDSSASSNVIPLPGLAV
ncbi:MAG: hypothetical protein MZV65_22575 [Chromatiales bacterium]|nr:hypothetical protein [Chromatiales bacterium]